MADSFRIALAQSNPTLGDLEGNAELARGAWEAGRAAGAQLVALPEMFVTGYNTQDLALKRAFVAEAEFRLRELARSCADGPALAIGGPQRAPEGLFNAYYLARGGRLELWARKRHLPNMRVFDEKRVFDPGAGGASAVADLDGVRVGVAVCEDAWHEDVARELAKAGAGILLVANGSPYERGKAGQRRSLMADRVAQTGLPLVYLNMVGGQDDQVFDGDSFALNPDGAEAFRMPVMEAAIETVELRRGETGWRAAPQEMPERPGDVELDYRAMVVAVRDYARKSGFERALLGLSGGVDSALAASVAADALGPDAVRCVMLPSQFTSAESLEDAAAVAGALGCRLDTAPIPDACAAAADALAPVLGDPLPGVAGENVQSRMRGLLLMALSNSCGELLLSTGNKSEVAVGYATIYGDMAGGYNPLKDLYKTRVFEACRWRSAQWREWMRGPSGEVIPRRVIEKPPSAELRAGQKDSDSLPDYGELDGILEILVDGDGSIADCVAAGYDRDTAARVEGLVFAAEHKRFQSAPGTRLTDRAFWLDRRYPIVNRWRDAGLGAEEPPEASDGG